MLYEEGGLRSSGLFSLSVWKFLFEVPPCF